ncbi:hypothetical protein L615_004300000230 [Nocardioides sp. J9]|nr:hypothetical protein L615_004300000230 [Nocardioides sp. J9]
MPPEPAGHGDPAGVEQRPPPSYAQGGEGQCSRGLRDGDPVLVELPDAPVEGADHAARAGRPLVLARPLVRAPPGAQPPPGLVGRPLQRCVLGDLLGMLLLPALALAPAAGDPAVVPAGVDAGPSVAAGVEIEEGGGDLPQERAVVADHGDAPGVLAQAAGQEVEGRGVEVVGRLVQQEQVDTGGEDDGQAHPVALADRQRGQPPAPVGARAEAGQGDVDTALGVPGVEPGGGLERPCVGVLGVRLPGGECLRRGVQSVEGVERVADRVADEVADRAVVGDVEGLLDQGQRAGAAHRAAVRREVAGEDVQERGLAAAVLADHGEARPGADGHVDAGQDGAAAARDGDALGAQVRRGARGQVGSDVGGCAGNEG